MKHMLRIFLPLLTALLLTTSCQPKTIVIYELATSAENNVTVSVTLTPNGDGKATLAATFTPQASGLHLYGKDIPKAGLDGLGRPTLLELPKDSHLQSVSGLVESAAPQTPASPPFELLIYPEGAVTLSMQVALPEGNDWLDDQVIVTYMACDETGCRPPVQQKPIAVKIPGKGLFQ
jgi:hypothetical protein